MKNRPRYDDKPESGMNMVYKNILSFNVEDWFHILDRPDAPVLQDWDSMPSRVENQFMRILDMLDDCKVKATCFFLGWVGEQFPHLVKEAQRRGHEIASHGMAHEFVFKLSREQFCKDILKAKDILEKLTGTAVQGYRAPGFSITEATPWFFDVLAQAGFAYDSSVFPTAGGRGGMKSAERHPYLLETEYGSIMEFPLSVRTVLGKRISFSGGGYFRLFPYRFIRKSIQKLNRSNLPAIVYLHPRDFDVEQPRLPMPIHLKCKNYVNLHTAERKFRTMLRDFSFTTFSDYQKKLLEDKRFTRKK